MKRYLRYLLSLLLVLATTGIRAESWDEIKESDKYYYGIGQGADTLSAKRQALADLVSNISTIVSTEFTGLDIEDTANGKTDHQSKVRMCVNTYSHATLTNIKTWVRGEAPELTVMCYMLRTEMDKVYAGRIKQAKDMIALADEALEKRQVGTALQYYYWAYALVCSIQQPEEATDAHGHLLMRTLPDRIGEVMADIDVEEVKREDDYIDLRFYYQRQPVKNLFYTYSDGQALCSGKVNNGTGMLMMAPGYEDRSSNTISIDYVRPESAYNDREMRGVLEVVGWRPIAGSERMVKAAAADVAEDSVQAEPELKPSATQVVTDTEACIQTMPKLLEAIKTRRYNSVASLFTAEGKDVFDQLITYGRGHILGEPNITFFKSKDGKVVARGLQMAFVFRAGTKTTFTEDVVFTFNKEGLIENVAFGLGQEAENDILCRVAPGWKEDTRELIMEFMENYKTAYCLKRLDYISDIFSDDAVIIVGNVTKRKPLPGEMGAISLEGQGLITENRYTKNEYLKNLKRCFARNEFINIHFTRNEVQYINRYKDKEYFAIQIGQEYNSSTYGDKGYLFLLVDMTNHDEPQIQIRTWQPNEVAMEKLYTIGNFFDE